MILDLYAGPGILTSVRPPRSSTLDQSGGTIVGRVVIDWCVAVDASIGTAPAHMSEVF